MTIASAFNDIAVAQGGTAAKSGAITAAIDALNDALAGSDQPQAQTIEQAVRLLGEHIGGGGGGGTEYNIKCYHFDGEGLSPIDSIIFPAVWDPDTGWWKKSGDAVTKAKPADILMPTGLTYGQIIGVVTSFEEGAMKYPCAYPDGGQAIVMPAHDICVVFGTQG